MKKCHSLFRPIRGTMNLQTVPRHIRIVCLFALVFLVTALTSVCAEKISVSDIPDSLKVALQRRGYTIDAAVKETEIDGAPKQVLLMVGEKDEKNEGHKWIFMSYCVYEAMRLLSSADFDPDLLLMLTRFGIESYPKWDDYFIYVSSCRKLIRKNDIDFDDSWRQSKDSLVYNMGKLAEEMKIWNLRIKLAGLSRVESQGFCGLDIRVVD